MRALHPATTLERFRPHRLTHRELAALAELHNAVDRETRPDDPDRPATFIHDHYATLADALEFDRQFWWVRSRSKVLGAATFSRRCTGDNPHVLHVELLVAPDARRRGIGTALLGKAVEAARENGQDVLIGMVTGEEPLVEQPGGRFLWRLGGRPGLEHRIYRLELASVDLEELQAWERSGQERNPDVETTWRMDAFEEDELVAVSQLMQAMNGAPRGDLKVEPYIYTPQSVAERDRALHREGFQRTVLLARERATSKLLGYTMMLVDPYDDRLLRQADTAVEPAARGRGLGKWLKAAMLLRMMREHPSRSEVRTGNADNNDAMLHINHAIGFRPWLAHSVWQVSLEALEAALGTSG